MMREELSILLAQGRAYLAHERRLAAEAEEQVAGHRRERAEREWGRLLSALRRFLAGTVGWECIQPPWFWPGMPRTFDGVHEHDVVLRLDPALAPIASRWVPDITGWRQVPFAASGERWAVVNDPIVPETWLLAATYPLALAMAEELVRAWDSQEEVPSCPT